MSDLDELRSEVAGLRSLLAAHFAVCPSATDEDRAALDECGHLAPPRPEVDGSDSAG